MTAASWTERAACAHTDPEIFFSLDAGSMALARSVCRSCPVQPDCLAASLTSPATQGIWAGFSDYQRRQIRREIAKGSGSTGDRIRAWLVDADGRRIRDLPPRRAQRARRPRTASS
ncbi:hypothetical protein JCM18899A_33450 [Nocardioides sp. AN3]